MFSISEVGDMVIFLSHSELFFNYDNFSGVAKFRVAKVEILSFFLLVMKTAVRKYSR